MLRLPLDAEPRAGFAATLSLPLRGLQATRAGASTVSAHSFIAEEGYFKHGFKRRVLRLAWRPDFTTPLIERKPRHESPSQSD